MLNPNTCPTCQQRVMSPRTQRRYFVLGLSLGCLGAAIGIYASVMS